MFDAIQVSATTSVFPEMDADFQHLQLKSQSV